MRVKKLNVNRRHKVGENETAIGVAADGDNEQRKWVSPTKPLREEAVSSGSSSPTDVQQQQHQHQHLSEHLPLQYQTSNNSELFVDGVTVPADLDMQEEEKVNDNPIRSEMIGRIRAMLQAMKPHAPEKVLAALPRLAQNMEKTLFKLAKNEAEYCDPATLRLRIAHIQEKNATHLLAQQQQQQLLEHTNSGNGITPMLKPLTKEQARIIFQHLQSWRQHLVNMYGVVPWDILPNSTLAKVALYMPMTEQELVVCGVENEKIARFGSSLIQELQRHRISSRPVNKMKTTQGRKASLGKRGTPGSLAGGKRNKKRKNKEAARLVSAPSSPNSLLLKSPAPLLPAVDSLPTLLPTVSIMPRGGGGAAFTTAPSSSMTMKQSQISSAIRLSPAQTIPQPFSTRLQPQEQQQQQQSSSSPALENHMHLLVQGAGELSKQQTSKSLEAYEQEVQSLRWMLHQSQQEKSRLEQEIEQLRSELQDANRSK